MEATADTLNYMIAGYAVIFGTMFLHLVSLIVRRRNLEGDLAILKELDEE